MPDFNGLAALERQFLKISSTHKIKDIMREEAENLLETVRNQIDELPISKKKSAELSASLRLEPSEDGLGWRILSESNYGAEIEYGSDNNTIMPWLGPSLITYQRQYCNCLQDKLITALSTTSSIG